MGISITHNGVTKTVTEWADDARVSRSSRSIYRRLQQGLSDHEALFGSRPNKNQALITGVSYRIKGSGQHRYGEFQVNWSDEGRQRVKSFHVGPIGAFSPSDLEAAKDAAIAFRREYKRCSNTGHPFDSVFAESAK